MSRLLRGEWAKLNAARVVLWGLLATLLVVAGSLAVNIVETSNRIEMLRFSEGAEPSGMSVDDVYWAAFGVDEVLSGMAGGVYTSGQYLGLLLALLFGVYLVGGEFSRRTIVLTLLMEPRRGRVLAAKLIVAVVGALLLWLVMTAVAVPVGVVFLRSEGVEAYLGQPEVIRSILLNAVAFVAWAVFGTGLGILLRSLVAAAVLASLLYLSSFTATQMLFGGGDKAAGQNGFDPLIMIPSVASHRLVDPISMGVHVSPWPGAAVLLGYGLAAGLAGLWLLWRRDV